jgi:hypothetical protein
MYLEALTVCVDYSDVLAETAKYNAPHFDHWVIVTAPQEKLGDTKEFCRKRNMDCVVTDLLNRRAGTFCKGKAIALGLNFLRGTGGKDSWVLHLDADVVLPPATRQMLDVADLDPTCLYGADRISCHSWEEWVKLRDSGYLHNQHGWHLCCNMPPGYQMGTRVINGQWGYTPIGFFQLWNYQEGVLSGWRYKDYPDTNSDAAHSDIKFALQWDRRKRILLPELVVVHLESESAPMGANWKGRTTKLFGPPNITDPMKLY